MVFNLINSFDKTKFLFTALHPVFSVAKITSLVLYSLVTKTLSNCSTKDKHNIRSSLFNSLPVCVEFHYTYLFVHLHQLYSSLEANGYFAHNAS